MRVLVVAEDVLVGARLAAGLSGRPGLVVEQAGLDADLIRVARLHGPDVIVWDLGEDAGELAQPLSSIQDLDTPVIVLSDDEARAAEAAEAGARGLLPRDTGGAPLTAAVQAVSQGLVVIDPAFVPAAIHVRGRAAEVPADELTHREAEVLQLLAEGLANKQIAQRLGISEHTVKFHVDSILGKLDAHSRTEAVTRAARLGLIVL